jgi:hypothetical protein
MQKIVNKRQNRAFNGNNTRQQQRSARYTLAVNSNPSAGITIALHGDPHENARV